MSPTGGGGLSFTVFSLMKIKKAIEKIWGSPLIYTHHAAAVDGPKKRAIAAICPVRPGQRVLDLGCGTGNSAPLFPGARYTGIDINPAYIAAARRRFPDFRFIAADAGEGGWGGPFEVILANSFLHHLADREATAILKKAASSLEPSGMVIIQEPLVPGPGEIYHRFLMKLDRGACFRTLEGWRELILGAGLSPQVNGFYELRIMGFPGYHMVSISARRRGGIG